MKNNFLTLIILTFLLSFLVMKAEAAVDASRLVLVVGEEATIAPFTPAQLRKLFLGLTQRHGGSAIYPLRNMSDERLYNVFLQKILFMSARNYERHLLSRVINMGGQRPPSYTSQTELFQKIRNNPHSVSYAWEKSARNASGIKVLQKLW